jgi:hypothetical protein
MVGAAWRAALAGRRILPDEKRLRFSLLLFLGTPMCAVGVALAISFRKFLFFPQCLTTIIPCLLVAIAYAIASLSSMPRVVSVVFASIYLCFSLGHLREIKSNAREAASVVAAWARPSDVIVIAPVWCASPFNYYYTNDNPQINYPHDGRRGAIDYDDLRARLRDSQAMARAKAGLLRAYREGRRVWLVTETGIPRDDVPDGDCLPVSHEYPTYAHVGRVRTAQLRKQLETLYGNPQPVNVPIGGWPELELFDVSLYTRNDLSPRTGDVDVR